MICTPNDREIMVFTGSAKATAQMKQYTKRAVQRAIELDRFIVFGDNPSGVDLMALITCLESDYKHFSIVNVENESPRSLRFLWHKTMPVSNYHYEDYHQRDLNMIRLADFAMFIWDGKSRGTREGCEYAVQQGIVTFLVNFETGQPVLTKSQEIMKVAS